MLKRQLMIILMKQKLQLLVFLLFFYSLIKSSKAQTLSNLRIDGNPTHLCSGSSYIIRFDTTGFAVSPAPFFKIEVSDQNGNFGSGILDVNVTNTNYSWLVPTRSIASSYSIRVTYGAKADTLKNLTISKPIPDFTFSPITPCSGSTVNFNNSSTGVNPLTFNWQFGTGVGTPSNSSKANPSVGFNPANGSGSQTYTVNLLATDQYGCYDNTSKNIIINKNPIASFTNTPNSICASTNVTFNATGTGNTPLNYSWQFGTGAPSNSTQQNPIVSFNPVNGTGSQTYNTQLTITDNNGCFTNTNKNIVVNRKPIASFSFSPDSACAGSPVTFTNTSTGNPPLTYNWNFSNTVGAPNVSSAANPNVSFNPTFGNGYAQYSVILDLTDGIGCTSFITKNVLVKKPTDSRFDTTSTDFDPYQNLFINCTASRLTPDYILNLVNASTTSNTSYNINWGDGNSNLYSNPFTSISHLYTALGFFNIALTTTNPLGCSTTKTYRFFNGNSPQGSLINPGNVNDCAPYTITYPVDTVNTNENPPGTNYTFSVNDGTPPLTFTQENLPSSITHLFSTTSCGLPNNAFTVTFEISNPCQLYYPSSPGVVKVTTKPKALFNINPDTIICQNTILNIVNKSIGNYFNTNGSLCFTTFQKYWTITPSSGWSLNAGVLKNGTESIDVAFTTPGVYSIKLMILRPGASISRCFADSITKTICVQPIPVPNFTFVQNKGNTCIPDTLPITNLSNTLNSCGKTYYKWSIKDSLTGLWLPAESRYAFINGTSDTSINPVLLFKQKGNYIIRLQVSNTYAGVYTKDSFVIIDNINPVINSSSSTNGTITPAGSTNVNSGTSQTYTFTPNSGYWIDSVIVNGTKVPTASSYTFSNVTSNQSIRVTYRSLAAALAAANICANDTTVATVNLPATSLVRATTYYSNIYLFNQNNTSNAYKYNVNDRKYTAIADKPTPCIECGVAEANGKIYCFNTNGTTQAYDISSNTWQTQTNQPSSSTSSLYAVSINNKVYVLGTNSNNQNTFTQYNPQNNTYSAQASPNQQTSQSRLVAYNNLIYKIGGITLSNNTTSTAVEVYNPSNNTWTNLPDLPEALSHVGATNYDNKLYVFGGKQSTASNSSNSNKVYVFDIAGNTWYAQSNTLNFQRANIEAKTANGLVYLFGGTDTSNTTTNQAMRYFCKDQLCTCKWAEYVCNGVSQSEPCSIPTPSINSLSQDTTANTGSLYSGTAATNTTVTLNYTGANGANYNARTIVSTGVTGLTATLAAGTLNNGNGTLTLNITGTPSTIGTASFTITIGGKTCVITREVKAMLYRAGTVFCNGVVTEVVEVTNPITGKTWMDRNLGASRAATSSTDSLAYGDLYQWGRGADGHQCRNSATTTTLSSTDQPGHGNFILAPNSPFDWRATPNENLWQGVNGVNNPCPTGYRLPNYTELEAERTSWSQNNGLGAFNSQLKLIGGLTSDGSVSYPAVFACFWSSSIISQYLSAYLEFVNNDASYYAYLSTWEKRGGMSVRCIKDYPASIGSLDTIGSINQGNLTNGIVANNVTIELKYTSGNGAMYEAQSIASSGVTGLTATLAAGTLNNGNGTLILSISGIPNTIGTANFNITFGGKTCVFTREVIDLADLTSINCNDTIHLGILYSNQTIGSNVMTTFSYTGGNGGFFDIQIVNSSGVTGITATINSGVLQHGSGTLNINFTGKPNNYGIAYFNLNIGGKTCQITRIVKPPILIVESLIQDITYSSGILYSGIEAKDIFIKVNYTGSNGGVIESQVINSTGVTGLSAEINSIISNVNNGSILIKISGVPNSNGIANFTLSMGSKTCIISKQINEITVGTLFGGGIVISTYQSQGISHGMILSLNDQGSYSWGCNLKNVIGTSFAIGTGENNTNLIVAASCNGAASVCKSLLINGFSGWYLPSLNELGSLYANRAMLNSILVANGGSPFSNYYWSSTQSSDTNAFFLNFTNGGGTSFSKIYSAYVRAIRNF